MPYSTMSSLFSLSNVVTRDKVKAIKLEFWKDDSHEDALAAYRLQRLDQRLSHAEPLPER